MDALKRCLRCCFASSTAMRITKRFRIVLVPLCLKEQPSFEVGIPSSRFRRTSNGTHHEFMMSTPTWRL